MMPDVHPLGLDGLLVRFAAQMDDAANRAALAFRAALEADPPDGVVETAPTLVSVRVRFDPRAVEVDALAQTLRRRAAAAAGDAAAGPAAAPARCWHIPMAIDPEAGDTAAAAGVDCDALVAAVTGAELRILTIGFAPGQPYLGPLPPGLDLPRRDALRPVRGGDVVLAVGQAVLFAGAGQTGWHPCGRTAFRVFRPDSAAPFPLQPGDAVRFHCTDPAEIEALGAAGSGDAADAGAWLEDRQ